MKKLLTLVLVAVVAFFYLFEAEQVQQTTPVAKKNIAKRATPINYEGAMVIKDLDDIDDILSELEHEPSAGAGTFDLTAMSSAITMEVLKAFSDSAERSLPLVAHWNVGIPEYVEAMDPMYMISRIELGEHVLVSWKLDPYYNDSISSSYYEESIKKAAELNLPLVFVLPAPESALTKDSYYFALENATNPNVVTTAGDVLEKLSPFGADELWNEVGEQWSSTSLMAQLQEWYPNPPLVLFVSEDEAAKLSWSELSQESRYTASGDDNFKRTLVGAEWIEKYRQMHDGFKKGFVNTTWKENVKFMTYNKFSENLGESNWLEDATLTNHYMNIWPLTADGATVDFDLSGSKTDNSADAPHVLVNNLPFMLNEAKLVNPNFAYQISLDAVSKVTEPAKYRGLTQFALWFLRPSIIRQASQESDREALTPLFQEVADSVELIHYNPQLARFWREGSLVNSGKSDLNQNIPKQYLNDPRWFLLETDANPQRPWADNISIPVWAFALVKGEAPNREWLVYAQSPEGDISDVTVSIPGYKDILVDGSVLGSFYVVHESDNKIIDIDTTILLNLNGEEVTYPVGQIIRSTPIEDYLYMIDFEEVNPLKEWVSNGNYTINFIGLTDEKSFSGKKSLKLDITLNSGTYHYWKIPLPIISTEGNLKMSAKIYVENGSSATLGIGANYKYLPSNLTGTTTVKKITEPTNGWITQELDLTSSSFKTAQVAYEIDKDGLLIGDTGLYMDSIGIFLYGGENKHIVVYIDDIQIKGQTLKLNSYNQEVSTRWNKLVKLLTDNIDTWTSKLINAKTTLRSTNTNSSFLNNMKQITLDDITTITNSINTFNNKGYITKYKKDFIESEILNIETAIQNIPKIKLAEDSNDDYIIYTPKTITNLKQLPFDNSINNIISNNISVRACSDEYTSKTFSIFALNDIRNIEFKVSKLINKNNNQYIYAEAIDIRVVKNWYQSGESIRPSADNILTPELLLKNDKLIKVDYNAQKNYLLNNGSYILISGNEDLSNIKPSDSTELQPTEIDKSMLKQYWLSIHIPKNTPAGNYVGTIRITSTSSTQKNLNINIEVLPFQLQESKIQQAIYYRGIITHNNIGSISSEEKTLEQYEFELKNLKEHGILYPTLYQKWDDKLLVKILDIRKKLDFPTDSIYIIGLKAGNDTSESGLERLAIDIDKWLSLLKSYNYKDVYIYGIDEAVGDKLISQRAAWSVAHDNGVKIFTSCISTCFDSMGDLLDLSIDSRAPQKSESFKYHLLGNKIFNYENPQLGIEAPKTYRKNYGLLLWQENYDGAMNYAYQHSFNNSWNDFDYADLRDHNMVYPTTNGVIDTIQWEGYKEGVNDLRYLSTLLKSIQDSSDIALANQAKKWLNGISLDSDLDKIRNDMIEWIIRLQS